MTGNTAKLLIITVVGSLVAIAVSIYARTIPFVWTGGRGLTPPFIPRDSPLHTLPFNNWFIAKPMMDLSYYVHKLIQWQTPPLMQLTDLMVGYWKSEVLYGLVYHGILEDLAKTSRGTTKKMATCHQVAQRLELVEYMVCHYMDAGLQLGLLYSDTERKDNDIDSRLFGITPTGAFATSSVPYNFKDFVLASHGITGSAWRGASAKSIKTGQSGVQAAHNNMDLWQYYELHPEERHEFDRLWKNAGYYQMGAALSSWKPPRNDVLFCDIGGGTGTATAIFLEHYPEATAIVMDQESVILRTQEFLKSRGLILENNGRAETLVGNLFEPLPTKLQNCDVLFLKWVLHDWPDEENIAILKHVRNVATKPGAKVVIMEVVPGTTISPQMETIKSLQTINMIAMCTQGARERTWQEHQFLLKMAGFQNQPKLLPTMDIMSVIEVDV